MKTNIMVDIETLGTEPDAVVLSIAAVDFDNGREFYRKIDPQVQLDRGRSVTAAAIEFWMAQPEEARAASFGSLNVRSPVDALIGFTDWLHNNYGLDDNHKLDNVMFWAKPPRFDAVILNSLYDWAYITRPWTHRQWRDVRTAMDIAGLPDDWKPKRPIAGVPHHPLYDCHWQIAQVKACYAHLSVRCGTWDL